MSLYFALRDIANNLAQIPEPVRVKVEPALIAMLRIRGTFPVSSDQLSRLKGLAFSESAKPAQVAELIQSDPFLTLRIISLVNLSFYSRGHAIMTTQGAVNHLGLMKIPDIAVDLAESKSFRTLYQGRAVSLLAFQETVLAGILARRIASLMAPREGLEDMAYVISVLSRIGLALLAYHRPNIYCACFLDTAHKPNATIDKNFKKVIGKTPAEFGAEAAQVLNLPKKLVTCAGLAHIAPWHKRAWGADEGRDVRLTVGAVHIANRLVSEISEVTGGAALDRLIEDMAGRVNLKPDAIRELVGEGVAAMVNSMNNLGLAALRIPSYVESYTEPIVERDGTINSRLIKWPGISDRVNSFISELRALFKTRSTSEEFYFLPQAILCTLRALIHGLNFDFAMFCRYSRTAQSLSPAVWLGAAEPGLAELERKRGADEQYMPDLQAALQQKAVFAGDPVFEKQWPFAAFPAICRNEVIGVFYAHKAAVGEGAPLDTQEQVAVIALAEEWYDMPAGFF